MSDTIERACRTFYEARRKATGLDIHGAVEVRWDDLPEAMKDEYRAGFQALHEAGMLVSGEPVAWRPIESAPRDGTWVMLTGGGPDYGWDDPDNKPPMAAAQFWPSANDGAGGWWFASYDSGYYGEWESPTHFMPLPSPPLPTEDRSDARPNPEQGE